VESQFWRDAKDGIKRLTGNGFGAGNERVILRGQKRHIGGKPMDFRSTSESISGRCSELDIDPIWAELFAVPRGTIPILENGSVDVPRGTLPGSAHPGEELIHSHLPRQALGPQQGGIRSTILVEFHSSEPSSRSHERSAMNAPIAFIGMSGQPANETVAALSGATARVRLLAKREGGLAAVWTVAAIKLAN
jgi:hypothetical protein